MFILIRDIRKKRQSESSLLARYLWCNRIRAEQRAVQETCFPPNEPMRPALH